jgi:hypothetical protein
MLVISYLYFRERNWQSTHGQVIYQSKAELKQTQITPISAVYLFVQTGLHCQDPKKK